MEIMEEIEKKKRRKEYMKAYNKRRKERMKAYCKEYQKKNKERIKEQRKDYREKNKELIKERKKDYSKKHNEHIKKYKKEYREKNKELIIEQGKEYYIKNKEYIKERMKCKNCKNWPDSQCGNPKYNGYCTRCFQQLFPNDPLTVKIRKKTKEIAVRDFINENFEGFIHDKTLYTHNCNCAHRRRIDHRCLIDNTILAIETDEYQHRSYDKEDEDIRLNDVYMIFPGKWIFIRFNPDKYINKRGQRSNPKMAIRLKRLKEEIEKQINRIKNEENTEPVENIKLYYDKFD